MSEEKDQLDKLLVEKFQRIMLDKSAPEALKQEVFRTLDFLEMFGDIAALYTSQFGEAELNLLNLINNEEDNDSFDSEEDKG